MKRILCLVLVFLFLIPAAFAAAIVDIIPDTSQWGYSRTKFKDANEAALKEAGFSYTDVEIKGLKGLSLPGFEIDGYNMDAYYDFAEKQGSYYGLSRVLYLLDVSKKVSDADLTKCYEALVKDMSKTEKPTTSSQSSSIWQFSDCTMEITVDKITPYNGSRNKTVGIIFSAPVAEAPAETPAQGSGSKSSKTMNVTATATCNDYKHVGNDWTQVFYVNGTKVGKNTQVALKAGDTVTVKATITETDKTPDVGNGTETHTVTKADLDKGFTVSFSVNVQENDGRYKDNIAKWNVKFTFK